MSAVTRFCQSADLEPCTFHTPYIDGIDELRDGQRTYGNNNYVRDYLISFVRAAWTDLMKKDGVLPFRHDRYLKAGTSRPADRRRLHPVRRVRRTRTR
jgi:hypothetical protein